MFNGCSNGYSLADIAAATGNGRNADGYNDGMWGNGAWQKARFTRFLEETSN